MQAILDYSGPYALEKKTRGAAGFDLTASESVRILSGRSVIVPTQTRVAIPEGYFGLVTMRSGHGFNHKLMCHIGIIDSDYRGEISVAVTNLSHLGYEIKEGERFAQLTILPSSFFSSFKVDKIENNTERGEGGFGHTGVAS